MSSFSSPHLVLNRSAHLSFSIGLYLSPSVIDNHTHFSSWALASARIDLYTARSAAEVLSRVKAWLPSQPQTEGYLVGQRMRVGDWTDVAAMNRTSLDEIEPSRPLAIFFAGFHSLCANSVALRMLGFEPEGHSGVLEEGDCFASWVKMNEVPEAVLDAAVDVAARNAAYVPHSQLYRLR